MHCVNELRYILFQFSYLHAFYKPNNITKQLNLKVKSYFQSSLDKETQKYSTLDPHGTKNEESMEKLLQGVIPLL